MHTHIKIILVCTSVYDYVPTSVCRWEWGGGVAMFFLILDGVSTHPQNIHAPSLSHCLNRLALISKAVSICVCKCVKECTCSQK